jgi:hypothetical protein
VTALRDEPSENRELCRERLALVVERHAHRHYIVVLFPFVVQCELCRNRAVQIHDDLLSVESVVVISIAPTERAGRDVAFFESRRDIGQGLGHRLLDLWIVKMGHAVLCNDTIAAIGDHEGVEYVVAVGRSCGGWLES